ncbi:MAG: hypothetical protein ACE15B_03165 [Bryobacteraceae bacterium]
MAEVLLVTMRWLHIAPAAILVGGMLYGRLVAAPDSGAAARRFRPYGLAAVAALIFSGLYSIFSTPGHSARYHMLLGVKLLLAAHVFAIALLVTAGKGSRPARLMTGAGISGLLIIAIAAYLRRIF